MTPSKKFQQYGVGQEEQEDNLRKSRHMSSVVSHRSTRHSLVRFSTVGRHLITQREEDIAKVVQKIHT